jgi:hypothetical protein
VQRAKPTSNFGPRVASRKLMQLRQFDVRIPVRQIQRDNAESERESDHELPKLFNLADRRAFGLQLDRKR